MPQIINLYKVNVIAYTQYTPSTPNQRNLVTAQSLPGISAPVVCTAPQQQQSILTINTVIQDNGNFVKVPLNTFLFQVAVQNNGISGTFSLGLSNPLTICLNPGHFTVTEVGFPPMFTFGSTIYSLTATTTNTSTNSACSADITAGKSLNCTITNTITGITQTASTNNTATISNNFTTLSAFGMASTNIKPDAVTLSLGVETTNKTANAAVVANSKSMNRVLDALIATDVRRNETSTSSFVISPNYAQTGMRQNITGFTATNLITIQSSNVTSVSKWIDASIRAGANIVNSIHFSLSNKKLDETKNTLIKNAIDDAKKKAGVTASALGLRVVGVKSVNMEVLESPLVVEAQGLRTGPVSGAMTSPIISGEQQIFEKVGIVFLLAR